MGKFSADKLDEAIRNIATRNKKVNIDQTLFSMSSTLLTASIAFKPSRVPYENTISRDASVNQIDLKPTKKEIAKSKAIGRVGNNISRFVSHNKGERRRKLAKALRKCRNLGSDELDTICKAQKAQWSDRKAVRLKPSGALRHFASG